MDEYQQYQDATADDDDEDEDEDLDHDDNYWIFNFLSRFVIEFEKNLLKAHCAKYIS